MRKMKMAVPVLLGLLSFFGCGTKIPAPQTAPAARPEEFRLLVEQGAREFAKMYWAGWKNAAGFYEKALGLRSDASVRQKLFDSLLLTLLRELELNHSDEALFDKIKALLPSLPARGNGALFPFVEMMFRQSSSKLSDRMAIAAAEWNKFKTSPIPDDPTRDWKSYIHLVLVERWREFEEARQAENDFLKRFTDTHLARFVDRSRLSEQQLDQLLAENPDFYELLLLRAANGLAVKKFQSAARDFLAALAAMPFYTEGYISLGNLYLRLDDEEQALAYYEDALKQAPTSGVALFGKGVCLSNLGRLDESSAVLKQTIEKQIFYHGEAYYYLAKNLYLQNRKQECRGFSESARSYIPDSVELNLLSGILYLEASQWPEAERDLRRVLEQNSQVADAHFYLGQIAWRAGKKSDAPDHFLKAARCLRQEAASLAQRREEIGRTDIPDEQRARIGNKLKKTEQRTLQDGLLRLDGVLPLLAGTAQEKEITAIRAQLAMRLQELAQD